MPTAAMPPADVMVSADTTPFSPTVAKNARRFFKQEPTPLVPLRSFASELGLAGVYAKDEGKRLGLQAFKVGGGAYAMATWVARKLAIDLKDVQDFEDLRARYFKDHQVPTTFVACTDGNHGRGLAWAAKQLGQHVVIYMPKGAAAARVAHIEKLGGKCTVTELNYDSTLVVVNKLANEKGWTLLQDMTLPGYVEVPLWIMQGYTAMADEAYEQMLALDGLPSHVILQVACGSMAGAVAGYFAERAKADGTSSPTLIILEAKNAACAFETAKRGDGQLVVVDGDLDTMIAGLSCGELSSLGWPILAQEVRGGFFWIDDELAGNGMRALAKDGMEAGECGGAAPGLLQRLMDPSCERAKVMRAQLGLGKESRVFFFNTEGATDPENYRRQLALPHVQPRELDFDFAHPLAKSTVKVTIAACKQLAAPPFSKEPVNGDEERPLKQPRIQP